MSVAFLPALPGLAWSVKKTPRFMTRRATHVSGRETRAALWPYPLYDFELSYTVLTDSAVAMGGEGALSLQALAGFYMARVSTADNWLYADPTDNAVVNGPLGTGDGATTDFVALRAFGEFSEPVSFINGAGISVLFNGVAPPVGTTSGASPPNLIRITPAPPAGTVLTASFRFWFVCKFTDDTLELENFMQALWSVQSLKFEVDRP